MNITECFPMRKRRSNEKTPGRSRDTSGSSVLSRRSSPVGKLRRTPHRLTGSSCNNSLLDQSLEIVWDNNSPSPSRTLALGCASVHAIRESEPRIQQKSTIYTDPERLKFGFCPRVPVHKNRYKRPNNVQQLNKGKRKKHHGSDSSSSGGEISDLVKKLADKSGSTPEANPPLLAFWMSRENITTVQDYKDDASVKGKNSNKQRSKEFQTPYRRPRRLRKCNKSKMKLLRQDIELLVHPVEKIEEKTVCKETLPKTSGQQQEPASNVEDTCTKTKLKGAENSDFFDGWDSDEDDLILSQVDFPTFKHNISETQVMTNTQYLGSGEDTDANNVTQHQLLKKSDHRTAADVHVDTNDSIVTESWDFVDGFGDTDDENVLQSALEAFEKSQQVSIPTVRRVSHLHIKPDMSHITGIQKKEVCGSLCEVNPLGKSSYASTNSRDHCSTKQKDNITGTNNYSNKESFSFVSRSSLQSFASARSENVTGQQVNQCNLKNTSSLIVPHTGQQGTKKEHSSGKIISKSNSVEVNINRQQDSTGQSMVQRGSKTAKYSKEDIERKKLEAQNRRRQKMAQSQQKHQN